MSDEHKAVEDYSDYEGGEIAYKRDNNLINVFKTLSRGEGGLLFQIDVNNALLRRVDWLKKRLKAAQS